MASISLKFEMGYLHKVLIFVSLLSLLVADSAVPPSPPGSCGPDAGGKECAPGFCCSIWGFCGNTSAYCDPENCQSQCPSPPPSCEDLSCLINDTIFYLFAERSLQYYCPAYGFYTYEAFIEAARSFPEFGNTGDIEARKRDIAAFFAQTRAESEYCDKETWKSRYDHCVESEQWPCVPGKKYYGRGPFVFSMQNNTRYGPCGEALGVDLLSDPDLLVRNAVASFQSALWLWMARLDSKPASCHDIMVGNWITSPTDIENGWVPGYGLTTNVISPGECGSSGSSSSVTSSRVNFYKSHCSIMGVNPGDNLYCNDQVPLSPTLLLDTK